MFSKITPEQAGISSRKIAAFIRLLEKCDFNTHGVLLMRGNKIFAEYYWAPFIKDTCHRMYSQTKSLVSIAIGLLEEEGKLMLDDYAYAYFPDRVKTDIPETLKKQTIRDMLKEATSCLAANNISGFNGVFSHGYGYQIWKTEQDGFAFVGMGNQLTVCLPKKDLIFAYIADNQGYEASEEVIINALFDLIANDLGDALPEDQAAEAELNKTATGLKLQAARSRQSSAFETEISGKKYVCDDNPMEITEFSLTFDGNSGGMFQYTNAQGKKKLPFGMGKNVFGKFPQFGYSNEHGGLAAGGDFMYDCAASAAWQEEKSLFCACR